jgi:hypothetical protein
VPLTPNRKGFLFILVEVNAMHTRSEIEKDMRKVFGTHVGLLFESQIKEYTNYGRDRLKTFLQGLPHCGNGRGKRWYVIDVAEKLAKEVTRP